MLVFIAAGVALITEERRKRKRLPQKMEKPL